MGCNVATRLLFMGAFIKAKSADEIATRWKKEIIQALLVWHTLPKRKVF